MSTTIPITVFTGFLGAGKTTLILSLLPHLNRNGYRACLLKNEYGDVQVDSQLAAQSALAGVSEILNGCMCCVLVGQMKSALLEIKDKFKPDRIFIETSGSAFPATLAFQIRELERETNGQLKLDAIVTVIDAENFTGYEDSSPTARMQASYTDLILINKWEQVSERQLETVMDHLHTLNDLTAKVRCNGREGVDPNLIFGLDTKLFADPTQTFITDASHNQEVETVTIWRGRAPAVHVHSSNCQHDDGCAAHVDASPPEDSSQGPVLTRALLMNALSTLPKESIWRVKGFCWLVVSNSEEPSRSEYILNWAFGRHELLPRVPVTNEEANDILFTVMGERGEMKRFARKFALMLGAQVR